MCGELLQSRLTLGDAVVCSPPGSSVRGILQARILEGLLALLQGIFSPGIEPASVTSPAWAGRLPLAPSGKPQHTQPTI